MFLDSDLDSAENNSDTVTKKKFFNNYFLIKSIFREHTM